MKKNFIIILMFMTCFLFGCSGSPEVVTSVPNQEDQTVFVPQELPPEPIGEDTNEQYKSGTQKVSETLKVHFIDVGQADCILVMTPDGKTMLIDAGNNADSDTIITYLKKQGVSKIDILIGTHPHEDHIGSMDSIIKKFDIGSVYLPKVSNNTKTFEDVLLAIKAKGLKIDQAKGGLSLDLGPEIRTDMIAPNSSSYEGLNNYSAVVKLSFGSNSFLFTGDAEELSEQQMLSNGYDLKADVLKVSHHGSRSSTSISFLKAVAPTYAVICVGDDNSYGHPHHETLDKLTTAKVNIYRTDLSGTIVATSDGENIKFNTDPSPVTKANPPPTEDENGASPIVAPVESSSGDPIVYITKSGEKYHLDGCNSLSKSKIPIKLSEAKEKGYGPCKRCNPPQ